jgi:hypothetical protein
VNNTAFGTGGQLTWTVQMGEESILGEFYPVSHSSTRGVLVHKNHGV